MGVFVICEVKPDNGQKVQFNIFRVIILYFEWNRICYDAMNYYVKSNLSVIAAVHNSHSEYQKKPKNYFVDLLRLIIFSPVYCRESYGRGQWVCTTLTIRQRYLEKQTRGTWFCHTLLCKTLLRKHAIPCYFTPNCCREMFEIPFNFRIWIEFEK